MWFLLLIATNVANDGTWRPEVLRETITQDIVCLVRGDRLLGVIDRRKIIDVPARRDSFFVSGGTVGVFIFSVVTQIPSLLGRVSACWWTPNAHITSRRLLICDHPVRSTPHSVTMCNSTLCYRYGPSTEWVKSLPSESTNNSSRRRTRRKSVNIMVTGVVIT